MREELLELALAFDMSLHAARFKDANAIAVKIQNSSHDAFKLFTFSLGRKVIQLLKNSCASAAKASAAGERMARMTARPASMDVLERFDEELRGASFRAEVDHMNAFNAMLAACAKMVGDGIASLSLEILEDKDENFAGMANHKPKMLAEFAGQFDVMW